MIFHFPSDKTLPPHCSWRRISHKIQLHLLAELKRLLELTPRLSRKLCWKEQYYAMKIKPTRVMRVCGHICVRSMYWSKSWVVGFTCRTAEGSVWILEVMGSWALDADTWPVYGCPYGAQNVLLCLLNGGPARKVLKCAETDNGGEKAIVLDAV